MSVILVSIRPQIRTKKRGIRCWLSIRVVRVGTLRVRRTRLTHDEAADVAANGMRVLSSALFEECVERAIAARSEWNR